MSENSETFGCVDGVCSVFPEVECVSFCETEKKSLNYSEKESLSQGSFDPMSLFIKGVLKYHTAAINSVSVSPDGRFIVSGSVDNCGEYSS